MMINNDYLVWFSAGWMKQNMYASCRILHDTIVFRNLLWWGNMPSLLIGSKSTRVYVREATDGWIFLRSYLDFPMYVLVPMIVSMILQSSRWWIFRVGIPHTTWGIHVLGSLSYQSILSGCGIEWQACVVAYSCDKLLVSHVILAGISIPPIPWPTARLLDRGHQLHKITPLFQQAINNVTAYLNCSALEWLHIKSRKAIEGCQQVFLCLPYQPANPPSKVIQWLWYNLVGNPPRQSSTQQAHQLAGVWRSYQQADHCVTLPSQSCQSPLIGNWSITWCWKFCHSYYWLDISKPPIFWAGAGHLWRPASLLKK